MMGDRAPVAITLINPNSTQATTDMMVAIAQEAATALNSVTGVTASRAPAIIVTAVQLKAAADEVIELGIEHGRSGSGVIIGAFGDPGLEALRASLRIPVVGLCESSMLAAAHGGRKFGVATITPDLVASMNGVAERAGLAGQCTGIRCTSPDPASLVADAILLRSELAKTVAACIEEDGAEAVIIGGGPLGQAAAHLQSQFSVPVIAPIPSAVAHLLMLIQQASGVVR
jgi:allantoin racemase